MNIDPNTGLPELPEGYFFRVTQNSFSGIFPWVQLRQHRSFGPFRWTRLISEKWSSAEYDSAEEKIAILARRLWENVEEWDKTDLDAQRLSGDYPPRSISGNPENRTR